MAGELYVATNAGAEQARLGSASPGKWFLPWYEEGTLVTGDTKEGDLLLSYAAGLLGRLDERVYVAEALAPVEPVEGGRSVRTAKARLIDTTSWDATGAAMFALDCAEHVLGEAGSVELPGGSTLAESLAEVRAALEQRAAGQQGFFSRLTDLALLRRLRREGREIGDAAFGQFVEDQGDELEYLEDPVWTAIAASRDAVLAAVEAVQRAVFPFVSELESSSYERAEESKDLDPAARSFRPHVTRLSWVPPWIAADDTAERARQAVMDAGGADVVEAELAWQADRLRRALDRK